MGDLICPFDLSNYTEGIAMSCPVTGIVGGSYRWSVAGGR